MSGSDLFTGTLDLLVLRSLEHGALHGYAIGRWIRERSSGVLDVEEGALYPSLHRLERRKLVAGSWSRTETGRRAKFYRLTVAGERQLADELARWGQFSSAVHAVLGGGHVSGSGRRLPLEPDPERDARDEVGFYLEERVRELETKGMPRAEAERAARDAFGDPERVAAEVAAIDRQRPRSGGAGWALETIAREVRQSARALARKPTFTAVVVLTLSLGIGAVTAVFSVVNASLIRALPFVDAERLVFLQGAFVAPEGPQIRGASPIEARDWERLSHSFEEVAAYEDEPFTLTGQGDAERLNGETIDRGYFELLGMGAIAGRLPSADEYAAEPARVVVLRETLWERRFGRDPEVLGRAIELNGVSFTVIGIVPADFGGMSLDADLWVTLAGVGTDLVKRGDRWLSVVGRLRPGVTVESARQDVDAAAVRLAEQYPDTNRDRVALVTPLRDAYLGSTRTLMVVVLCAAGLLLLIAAINVSNLLLVRSAAREGELLLRRALGAGRRALARQLVLESLLLSAAGAAGGLCLGIWGARILAGSLPDGLLPTYVRVTTDARVFLLVAGLMSVVGLLVGLLPAVAATRGDLATGLRERTGGGTAARAPFQRALVVGEVAIALVLMVGAGLMVRSLGAQLGVETGFAAERLLSFRLELPALRYADADARRAAAAALLARLEEQPRVEAATLGSDAPLRGSSSAAILWTTSQGGADERIRFYRHFVEADFFRTMGIELRSGRAFDAGDQNVAVISRALAERHFPGQDPIGRSLWLGSVERPPVTIVGVTEDVRYRDLTTDLVSGATDPDVFLPWQASPTGSIELIVRTTGDPAALTSSVRDVVRAFDPDLPPYRIAPLSEGVREQTAQARFGSQLLSAFSALAGLLAAVGLYGVLSFAVSARTREIALRMAVGADGARVRRMIVTEGVKLTGVGLVLGALVAAAGARSLGAFLYGVRPVDLTTYLAMAALLGGVAALAAWIPALRATRVDPNRALAGG